MPQLDFFNYIWIIPMFSMLLILFIIIISNFYNQIFIFNGKNASNNYNIELNKSSSIIKSIMK